MGVQGRSLVVMSGSDRQPQVQRTRLQRQSPDQHRARCLSRRTERGGAYGVVTAKALAVLEALLWAFHNAKSGLCFRGYEKIAEGGGWLRRSTAAEAIKALEGRGGPLMGPVD